MELRWCHLRELGCEPGWTLSLDCISMHFTSQAHFQGRDEDRRLKRDFFSQAEPECLNTIGHRAALRGTPAAMACHLPAAGCKIQHSKLLNIFSNVHIYILYYIYTDTLLLLVIQPSASITIACEDTRDMPWSPSGGGGWRDSRL